MASPSSFRTYPLSAINLPDLSITLAGPTGLFLSPVTGSMSNGINALTISFGVQAQNSILAAPTGSASTPSFRPLQPLDVPILGISNTNLSLGTIQQLLIGSTANGVNGFAPRMVRVIITAATAISIPATISIGTVAGSYIDIMPLTALTSLTSINKMVNTYLSAAIGTIAAGTAIYLNIGTAITGTSASCRVDVIGDYF